MRPHPKKWLKYQKLVEAGLLRADWLDQEIRRYSSEQAASLLRDIETHLKDDVRHGHTALYVIKLVPQEEYGQLPNYRVSSTGELDSVANALHNADMSHYVEAWWCRTPIGKAVFSVAGRLAISAPFDLGQIVEVIWRYSPRVIETLNELSAFTFIRAHRPSWGWRYRIDNIHIGQETSDLEEEILREFWAAMRLLEEAKEPLQIMSEEFDSKGLVIYSFEFKVIGGQLYVIDWDTGDDRRILNG